MEKRGQEEAALRAELTRQAAGPGNPPSQENFKPRSLIPPAPPITKFPITSAELANEKTDDAKLVLGVVVKGEALAYPVNMLTGPSREVLNDTLGGRAIAATW